MKYRRISKQCSSLAVLPDMHKVSGPDEQGEMRVAVEFSAAVEGIRSGRRGHIRGRLAFDVAS